MKEAYRNELRDKVARLNHQISIEMNEIKWNAQWLLDNICETSLVIFNGRGKAIQKSEERIKIYMAVRDAVQQILVDTED